MSTAAARSVRCEACKERQQRTGSQEAMDGCANSSQLHGWGSRTGLRSKGASQPQIAPSMRSHWAATREDLPSPQASTTAAQPAHVMLKRSKALRPMVSTSALTTLRLMSLSTRTMSAGAGAAGQKQVVPTGRHKQATAVGQPGGSCQRRSASRAEWAAVPEHCIRAPRGTTQLPCISPCPRTRQQAWPVHGVHQQHRVGARLVLPHLRPHRQSRARFRMQEAAP